MIIAHIVGDEIMRTTPPILYSPEHRTVLERRARHWRVRVALHNRHSAWRTCETLFPQELGRKIKRNCGRFLVGSFFGRKGIVLARPHVQIDVDQGQEELCRAKEMQQDQE
jgi:hypothetical protein